jgi:hypothetical protein
VAQHGNTSTQRAGLFGRILDGWEDVRYAQHAMAMKNHPWSVSPAANHVRRSDV